MQSIQFLQVLTSRFLQRCGLCRNQVIRPISETSDNQINLTFSEVEEMCTKLTCDFVAVSDNQRHF